MPFQHGEASTEGSQGFAHDMAAANSLLAIGAGLAGALPVASAPTLPEFARSTQKGGWLGSVAFLGIAEGV